jgi:hypothetical protein
MPFYHNPRSFVLKVVSIRNIKITKEEKIGGLTLR